MKMQMAALGAVALLVTAVPARAQQPSSGAHDHQAQAGEHASMGHHATDDASYVRMMKMHHQQGVKMADLAIQKAQRDEVRQFAQQTKASQQKDIEELERLERALPAGTSGTSSRSDDGEQPAKAHDHGGAKGHDSHMKMGQEMLQSLQDASGERFDQEFVRAMLKHHQMGIAMSKPASQFESAEVKSFAEEMVRKQGDEAEQLRAMQGAR